MSKREAIERLIILSRLDKEGKEDILRLIRLEEGSEDIFDRCRKVASIDLDGGYQG